MLCRVYSATCVGLEVVRVTVEVSISQGVGIYLVGLPDSAVRESLLRVTTALSCYEFRIPGKKTVINMAPANIKKEGSSYDAAIAVGLLAASGQIPFFKSDDFMISGELALDGTLRPISGALPIAVRASNMGFKSCIFPKESAIEASQVEGIEVYGASSIIEIIDILNREDYTEKLIVRYKPQIHENRKYKDDFEDVMGQEFAKRGLEISACGGHNVILIGSPGSGKSFMAHCLASILPAMNHKEALETSMIYSVSGKLNEKTGLMVERPFRCPHHTASMVSLVGGGTNVLPGEISLAHNGVLYLDEISQYPMAVLDVLRQPLEERCISISRAKIKVRYPANFILVGSMNPCPCGYAGEDDDRCTCSPGMIARYRSKISGPFLDRIDLNIRVRPVERKSLIDGGKKESSLEIAKRVAKVRERQLQRFVREEIYTNSQMNAEQLARYCHLGPSEKQLIDRVIERYSLSARAYSRILKISRTIADMEGSPEILVQHISEAVQYRCNIE